MLPKNKCIEEKFLAQTSLISEPWEESQVIGVTEGQRKGWTSVFAALKAKGPELCELYRHINLSNPVNSIHKEQEEQIQSKQRKTNTGKQLTARWQTAA